MPRSWVVALAAMLFVYLLHLRRPKAIRSDRRSIRRRGTGNDGAGRLVDSDPERRTAAAEASFGLLVRSPLDERFWSQRIWRTASRGAGHGWLVPGHRSARPASGWHVVRRTRRCADLGDVHRHFFLHPPRDAGAFSGLFHGIVILVAAQGTFNRRAYRIEKARSTGG